ncbi:CPBP family intramembrane metalloprotease [Microbacterium sp. dk485]|uniref:CPBP family glutamic-type intramembrane protease n=1 Tax=Microbacterium TaxID=33882 RepID=UPI0010738D3E|nr:MULTISPECIES: CPBP family glutamic-type intramembrane protease [Microbacterium]TFV81761.1 CPBP family intramembrane metalloprotease [Microbacterium sp. dk485]TXK10853.1 CPBP family intramembrane metalloprotease [Microbacterium wangchenii]
MRLLRRPANRLTRPARREIVDIAWFLTILLAASAVFYVVGPLIGSLSSVTRANVPAAALMFVCPAIAAVVVAARTRSLRQLGAQLAARPRGVFTGAISIVAMPVVLIVSAVVTGRGAGFEAPGTAALGLAVVFLVSAFAEQVGWTAFLLPRLRAITGELRSGLFLGVVWAVWHVIPLVQAGHAASWIVGQCVFTVVLMLLLVRLTVAGGSVWWAVICQASSNLAWALSPAAGEGYDPWVTAALTAAVVALLHLHQLSSARARQRSVDGVR